MDEKNIPIESEETLEQKPVESEVTIDEPEAEEEILAPEQLREKRKKIVKRIVIVCVAIVMLYALFTIFVPDSCFEEELPPIPIDQNIYLYPVDWEWRDITLDEEYLELDRRIHFFDVDSGASYSVEAEDLPTVSDEIRFFYDYFQILILGDAELYADLFAPEYGGTYEIPEEFTPQMVYDIHIEPYFSETGEEDTYKVFYKIAKNDGTFRDDIGEIGGVDVGCDMLFVLRPDGNSYLIENITRFTRH